MRWPWESESDYKARLDARTKRIQARQQGRSARAASRTGVKVAREEAKAAGGYYSAEAVAARQGTVQGAIGTAVTAAEGVAQAFGYDVDLDGSGSALAPPASAPARTASDDGTLFGMDRTTVLLAGVGVVALVVLMGRKS
jgi:hypothetical protein